MNKGENNGSDKWKFVRRPFKACGLIKTETGWQTILGENQTFYSIDSPDKWRFRERNPCEIKGINGEPLFPKKPGSERWMFVFMWFVRLLRGG